MRTLDEAIGHWETTLGLPGGSTEILPVCETALGVADVRAIVAGSARIRCALLGEALTRLQRNLSASLFMHDEREVFVTFSAGITEGRPGETLDAALERADEALYEAKRTGKNRTCIG